MVFNTAKCLKCVIVYDILVLYKVINTTKVKKEDRTMKSKCICVLSSVMLTLMILLFTGIFAYASSPEDGTTGQYDTNISWSFQDGILTVSGSGKWTDDYEDADFPDDEKVSKIIIKEGIANIPNFAFSGFENLESVEIKVSEKTGVTEIGDSAFSYCPRLKEIIIPDTVKKIGANAFEYCSSLKSIKLPRDLTEINERLFYYSGIETVTIPSAVKTIGKEAFSCCKIEKITLPMGIEEIKDFAFSGADVDESYGFVLKEIILPESLKKIGRCAFLGCRVLNVEIPKNVESIGGSAFDGCKSFKICEENTYFSAEGGNLYDKNKTTLLQCYAPYAEMPSTVVTIAVSGGISWIPKQIKHINSGVFNSYSAAGSDLSGSSHLFDIYYEGSEAEWKQIGIAEGNPDLPYAWLHYSQNLSDVAKLAEACAWFPVEGIFANNNRDWNYIVNDLILPSIGLYESQITWASSDPAIISPETGTVTRPSGKDAEVTITATIKCGTAENQTAWECIVKASNINVPDKISLSAEQRKAIAKLREYIGNLSNYDEITQYKLNTIFEKYKSYFSSGTGEAGYDEIPDFELKNAKIEIEYVKSQSKGGDYAGGGSAGGGGTAGGLGTVVQPVDKDSLSTAQKNANLKLAEYIANLSNYDKAEQNEINKIIEDAKNAVSKAATKEDIDIIVKDVNQRIGMLKNSEQKQALKVEKDEFKNMRVQAQSKLITVKGKKAIRISWTEPNENIDGYEVFRSLKRNSGYGTNPYFQTTNTKYVNTKNLKSGKTYYYRVRAYKMIDGTKIYSSWSFKVFRTIK